MVYFERVGVVWADYDAPPGIAGQDLRGHVKYTICNDRICLPPTETLFEEVVIAASDPLGGVPGIVELSELSFPTDIDVSGTDPSPGRRAGLWAFLFLAVGAGFGAFLMPCVYPMIPVTVSYFTHHVRASAIRMALVYGGAIVGTFTGLGTLLSILFSSTGVQSVAANPWVNLFIATAFTVFALSLLGFFELRLPSSLVNWFGRRGEQSGSYAGVMFMGLTLTLVSFSCTVPFVGLTVAFYCCRRVVLWSCWHGDIQYDFCSALCGLCMFPKGT